MEQRAISMPPSLPKKDALRVYVRALVWAAPSTLVMLLWMIFVHPSVEAMWFRLGAQSSHLETLLRVLDIVRHQGKVLVAAVLIVLVCLEVFAKRWSRFRRVVLEGVTFCYTTAVLLIIAGQAVGAIVLSQLAARAVE